MAKKRTRAVSLSLDWDSMIKDGEESEKGSKAHLASVIAYDRDSVEFCTGSSYSGKWNTLGMAVYGNYVYPHGCEYEGGFEDGMFHGEGTLIYPMGQRLEGVWEKGKIVSFKFTNVDGLDYNEDWTYCVMPDRRFNVSLREGLQPAGREFMTNQQPERPLFSGMYDTGDGYYNPLARIVIMARDPADYANVLEDRDTASLQQTRTASNYSVVDDSDGWLHSMTIVSEEKHKWIVKNCRKGWDEPAGYRPDLYEDWVSGRAEELEELDTRYVPRRSVEESSENSSNKGDSGEDNLITEENKTLDFAGTARKLSQLDVAD